MALASSSPWKARTGAITTPGSATPKTPEPRSTKPSQSARSARMSPTPIPVLIYTRSPHVHTPPVPCPCHRVDGARRLVGGSDRRRRAGVRHQGGRQPEPDGRDLPLGKVPPQHENRLRGCRL